MNHFTYVICYHDDFDTHCLTFLLDVAENTIHNACNFCMGTDMHPYSVHSKCTVAVEVLSPSLFHDNFVRYKILLPMASAMML